MKYLDIHDIQMAYDLLVGANPQIVNDAQEFVELLVRIYGDDYKIGWREVRLAMRNL